MLAGLAERVAECNTARGQHHAFVPLHIGSTRDVGFVRPDIAHMLARSSVAFDATIFSSNSTEFPPFELSLKPSLLKASPSERTNAVARDTAHLHGLGLVPGWRDELFPVVTSFSDAPLFCVERAAAVLLGIKAYGVHCNGFVRRESDGKIDLWVATRSSTKSQFPSMLDHLCAGGQPQGISPTDNMVKELAEEANVPPQLARTVVPTGAVSYETLYNGALKRDVLFTFDLCLPESFTPENTDGEIASFERVDAHRVLDIVSSTQDYKPNCSLVLLDFFFRHGFLSPNDSGYLQLFASLRTGDCS